MNIRIDILRRAKAEAPPWRQSIPFETEQENTTVAAALNELNSGGFRDIYGEPVEPICWDCACLQKKCGACAMVINGKPCLACDAVLKTVAKKGIVTLEPLRKFPVVADLMVDRSILFENLALMKIWAEKELVMTDRASDEAYDASRCLQCGCCLEVCPNFCAGDDFFGAAGFVPTSRLLASMAGEEQKRVCAAYASHAYEGCGKSLSCAKICPAGIDIEHLLLRTNARMFRRKHDKM